LVVVPLEMSASFFDAVGELLCRKEVDGPARRGSNAAFGQTGTC
jgi:hypothetical protein